jgi:hypothetical protein
MRVAHRRNLGGAKGAIAPPPPPKYFLNVGTVFLASELINDK